MAAVHRSHFDISLRLIEAGATPHLLDKVRGSSEAWFKCCVDTCHKHTKSTQDGTTALFLAIFLKQTKVIDALLAKEPNLNVRDKVKGVINVSCAGTQIATIFLPTQYGETVLIVACKMKNLQLVRDLLKQNADPNIANNV